MEYLPQLDALTGKVAAVEAGRSAWIWQGAAGVEEWESRELRAIRPVVDGADWAVSGERFGEGASYVQVTGAVVAGSDAALYGAPEVLLGTHGSASGAPVRLHWDTEASTATRWIPAGGWAELLRALRERAAVEAGE
jgi:hypothetical protein